MTEQLIIPIFNGEFKFVRELSLFLRVSVYSPLGWITLIKGEWTGKVNPHNKGDSSAKKSIAEI